MHLAEVTEDIQSFRLASIWLINCMQQETYESFLPKVRRLDWMRSPTSKDFGAEHAPERSSGEDPRLRDEFRANDTAKSAHLADLHGRIHIL